MDFHVTFGKFVPLDKKRSVSGQSETSYALPEKHYVSMHNDAYGTVQYDTIVEFNVDWKDECGQLNLAHVARNKK